MICCDLRDSKFFFSTVGQLRYEPHHPEANQHYADLEPLKFDIYHAHQAFEDGAYPDAVEVISRVLEVKIRLILNF
jgi:hypothetical protein